MITRNDDLACRPSVSSVRERRRPLEGFSGSLGRRLGGRNFVPCGRKSRADAKRSPNKTTLLPKMSLWNDSPPLKGGASFHMDILGRSVGPYGKLSLLMSKWVINYLEWDGGYRPNQCVHELLNKDEYLYLCVRLTSDKSKDNAFDDL